MNSSRIRYWSERLSEPVLFLTGAGISVASNLQTFRGVGGLYQNVDAYRLASPEGFEEDPVLVWNWYEMRIRAVLAAQPNAAHLAIAKIGRENPDSMLVTTNVDDLHERAGSAQVHHLHGRILQTRCTRCQHVDPVTPSDWPESFTSKDLPKCGSCSSLLRPDVVWFGEYPNQSAFKAAIEALRSPGTVIEVGVSGNVSYGLVQAAVSVGKAVLRINPDGEEEAGVEVWREGAESALPALLGYRDQDSTG